MPYFFITVVITLFPIVAVVCFPKVVHTFWTCYLRQWLKSSLALHSSSTFLSEGSTEQSGSRYAEAKQPLLPPYVCTLLPTQACMRKYTYSSNRQYYLRHPSPWLILQLSGRVHDDMDLAYDRSVQNLFALKVCRQYTRLFSCLLNECRVRNNMQSPQQDVDGSAGMSSATSTGSWQTVWMGIPCFFQLICCWIITGVAICRVRPYTLQSRLLLLLLQGRPCVWAERKASGLSYSHTISSHS